MRKDKLLLFEVFTIAAILISGHRVLANADIKTVEQKDEGKDWIEELKEEIKAIEQANEGKNWIEELKEEIREVDKERNVKDQIKTEKENKKQVSRKKFVEEIGTGLSEKGIYLDFLKNLKAKNKFGIRVNYLPEDFFTHQDIYVDDTNVKAEYFGIGMLYQHFLFPKESRSNFYLQSNLDVSKFKFSREIDLSKERRKIGNVVYTCGYCGILKIETDPNAIYVIPSLNIGYQFMNTKNFKTNISLGIQYINPATLQHHVNDPGIPPSSKSWIEPRINDYVKNSQNKVDSYSEFQPSINIGFSYSF